MPALSLFPFRDGRLSLFPFRDGLLLPLLPSCYPALAGFIGIKYLRKPMKSLRDANGILKEICGILKGRLRNAYSVRKSMKSLRDAYEILKEICEILKGCL